MPVGYLAGKKEKSAVYFSVFGQHRGYLERLKSLGIDSIELRGDTGNVTAEEISLAAENVWAAGMGTTLHSCLPDKPEGRSFNNMFPSTEHFIENLKRSDKKSVVTVHSYVSAEENIYTLYNKTILALKAVSLLIKKEDIPVKVAVEIKRTKPGRFDPGTTYRELACMLREAGTENLGFCWDLGHSYSNVLGGFLESMPSDEFLSNVIHTHIHDLGGNNQTHWPLGRGKVPLDEFVRALRGAGYPGVYNLELSPGRFKHEGNPRGLIDESISILRKALDRAYA